MLRLKRHIVTEILEVFFAVIVALTLIMVSFQFAKLLGMAAAGRISGGAVYQLVVLQGVRLAVLLTPFAFFIATLIALSRLANDNELIAMKSVGYSDWHTYQALLIVAVPLAVFILVVSLWVLPNIMRLNYDLLQKARKESELSIIQPGNFRTVGGNTTVFVADIDSNQFSKFFVWQQLRGEESVTVARQGKQVNEEEKRHIELTQGTRYFVSDTGQESLMSFERLTALLPEISQVRRSERLSTQPTAQLYHEVGLDKRLEIQRRISPALTIVLLALLAPLLVQFNPRANRYGKFVIAILSYAIYTNSQFFMQALIERGSLPIVPGLYTAHVIFIILWLLWIMVVKGHYKELRVAKLRKKEHA